jgi:hypothetical protein
MLTPLSALTHTSGISQNTFHVFFFLKYRINSQNVIIKKCSIKARCQWLTPAILVTQEAEIRRIEVRSQSTRPYPKKPFIKKDW